MTDIDVTTGGDFSNQTQTIVNGTEIKTRTISTSNTGWMLGTGWILFVFSQVMNFIFYKLHPSSPEMWTWGKAEELEEWEPQEEKQTQAEEMSPLVNDEVNGDTESIALAEINQDEDLN